MRKGAIFVGGRSTADTFPPETRALLLGALPSLQFSLIPGQTDTGGQTIEAKGNFEAWLPRFNVLYRISPEVNVFATVSKGRRSPVVQVSGRVFETVAAKWHRRALPLHFALLISPAFQGASSGSPGEGSFKDPLGNT